MMVRIVEKRIRSAELLLLSILILSLVASLCIGSYNLSPQEVLSSLINGKQIIWNIRLPRIVTAVIVGASLAVSGAVMQCILRNPLASPFTLGVSQGAAFGAAFAIIYLGAGLLHRTGESITILNPYLVPAFAFLGSLISVFVILILAKVRDFGPEAMILAGVAMASLFQAATMLMQYFAESDVEVASVVFWTFGDMGRTYWNEIYIMLAVFLIAIAYFTFRRMDYNALTLSDETAVSLGVNPQRIRLEGMLMAAFLTAVCVSFTGIVGFVGLVAPHSVRISITGDYRYLIPLSTISGAALLLIADTFGRTVISPVIIPVGIVTAFIGAPTFIYLLMRR